MCMYIAHMYVRARACNIGTYSISMYTDGTGWYRIGSDGMRLDRIG